MQIEIDKRAGRTLVDQLSGQIKKNIRSRRLKRDQQIPSIRQLSREHGISEGIVRQAIQGLANEGYLRTHRGRGVFVNGLKPRQGHLALVLPTLGQEHIFRIMEGVKQELTGTGLDLVVLSAELDFSEEMDLIRRLDANQLTGALIYPPFLNQYAAPLIELSQRGVPFVLVDTVPTGVDVDSVTADTEALGYLAALELLKKGHRSIGMVDTVGDAPTVRALWGGVEKACLEFELKGDQLGYIAPESVSLDAAHPWASGKELTARLLRAQPDLTALIAASATIGLGALLALKEIGRKVPDDLSLVAIGDVSTFQITNPPVTVVDPPYTEMGRLAARRLLSRVDHPRGPKIQDRLTPKVIRRQSIAERMTIAGQDQQHLDGSVIASTGRRSEKKKKGEKR